MEGVRTLTTRTSNPVVHKGAMFLGAITFHESIFALPFAYTGMVLAADGLPTWHQFTWITVAMVSARTVGMSANRIIDRHIDARNPRSAGRHLPSGRLRAQELGALAAVSLGVFMFAAAQLNGLALALAPVAIVYLVLYPYTKRFTWTANLLLGWALAISPSAAWIGVTGRLGWEPVLLSLSVALWAGSFDILYHTQDYDFHVREGYNSVARRFGIPAAFKWARALDALAIACMLFLGLLIGLAFSYFVGLAVAVALLVYKHRLVSADDLTALNMSFFRINAYVSMTMLAATLAAIFV